MELRKIVAFVICLLPAAFLHGQAYTFGTFHRTTTDPFAFTNYVNSSSVGTGGSIWINAPIVFNYTQATGFDTSARPAVLEMGTELTISTQTPVTATPGGSFDQPIGHAGPNHLWVFDGMVDPYHELAIINSYYTGAIVGVLGSNTATFTGRLFMNRSDFFNFPNPYDPSNTFSFHLTATTPFSIGTDGILNSFTADISGQFSANAVPNPEPVSGLLLAIPAITLRRRRHR